MTEFVIPASEPKWKNWKSFKLVEPFAVKIDAARLHEQRTRAETALIVGCELCAAQAALSHRGNGVFGKWTKLRLKITRSQGRRYMQVWEIFGKDPVCANLAQT